MKVEHIVGDDIQVGDVITTAAWKKVTVRKRRVSSTGNTIEVNDAFRVGRRSKVKRYVEEEQS